MVKFYKDGDHMGIETDCEDVEIFLGEVSSVLAALIEARQYEGDWQFQLDGWLPRVFEICSKLCGEDSSAVATRTLTSSGNVCEDDLVARKDKDLTVLANL